MMIMGFVFVPAILGIGLAMFAAGEAAETV
jgi:hypothetical protein